MLVALILESMFYIDGYRVEEELTELENLFPSVLHLADFLEPDTGKRNSGHFNLWPKQKVLLIKI